MAGRKPLSISVKDGTQLSTLVLHPADESTHFLMPVYLNLPECRVIRDFSNLTDEDVIDAIRECDRVLMLGHGDETGLFDRKLGRYVVHLGMAVDLKKKDCVFIWCNANIFRDKYDLKGFATGMFVSEIEEAYDCGVPTTIRQIEESNALFSRILGEAMISGNIEKTLEERYIIEGNPCVNANREFSCLTVLD